MMGNYHVRFGKGYEAPPRRFRRGGAQYLVHIKLTEANDNVWKYLPIGFFFGLLFLFLFSFFVLSESPVDTLGYQMQYSASTSGLVNWTNEFKIKGNNLVQLGVLLYTTYLPYLLIAAIILLVAMLGVIVLTFTQITSKQNHYQTAYQQNSAYLNNHLFS
jgi:formate hydrogenlyase subunit 4